MRRPLPRRRPLGRASMKGFPRRGSDYQAPDEQVHLLPSLNEGLPQKGKRSGGRGGVGWSDNVPQ